MKQELTYDILKAAFESYITEEGYFSLIIQQSILLEPLIVKLETKDTLWISAGDKLSFNGFDFKVDSLKVNDYLICKLNSVSNANDLLLATQLQLNFPFVTHSTVRIKSIELDSIDNHFDKYPAIWIHDITRDEINNDPTSSIEKTSNLDIYFFTEVNFEDYNTDDHYELAIKPMRNLAMLFISSLDNPKVNYDSVKFTLIDHMNLGVYEDFKGHTKNLFNDRVSGVQLRITIPILKQFGCCNC